MGYRKPEIQIKNVERQIFNISNKIGLNLRTISKDTWLLFSSLSEEKKTEILERVLKWLDELLEMEKSEVNLNSNQSIVRYILKKRALSVHEDFFDQICDSDVIEIYDTNLLQTFRNFKFLDITNYNFVDLEIFEWPVLFERHESVTQKLVSAATKILSDHEGLYYFDEIAAHLTKESKAEPSQLLWVKHICSSPLFDENGVRVGLILNEKVSISPDSSEALKFIKT